MNRFHLMARNDKKKGSSWILYDEYRARMVAVFYNKSSAVVVKNYLNRLTKYSNWPKADRDNQANA